MICSELKKRFPGSPIISVTGVRAEESAARAKASIGSVQPKLSRKGLQGWDWRPILQWSLSEVLTFIESKGEHLHEAYQVYGSSRVSCVFCCLASLSDLRAAASCPDNEKAYRRLVDIEISSTFAFQGNRWLGDIAPHLLDPEKREALGLAKERGRKRVEAESRIPDYMLYVSGWPRSVPSLEEAKVLGGIRKEVCEAVGVEPSLTDADQIVERYRELFDEHHGTQMSLLAA